MRAAQKPLRIRAESAQNPRTRGPFGSFVNPFSSFVGPFGSFVGPFGSFVRPFGSFIGPFGSFILSCCLMRTSSYDLAWPPGSSERPGQGLTWPFGSSERLARGFRD